MSLKLTLAVLFSLSFISSCYQPPYNPYTSASQNGYGASFRNNYGHSLQNNSGASSQYRASCECSSVGYTVGMGSDQQSAVSNARGKCNAARGSSATNCKATRQ